MKVQLNKIQVRMLLDGKPLQNGRDRYMLPPDFENRGALEKWIEDVEPYNHCDVFFDTADRQLTLAVRKPGGTEDDIQRKKGKGTG